MSTLKVGFVGLGAMGGSMAGHLHRLGLLVAVSNRTHAKAERFADEHVGVQAFLDPGALAAHCDVVVSCVTADSDVLALAEALARRAQPGFVLVDTSTIASTSAKRAAEVLRAVDADFIDAPVSGGVEGAKNGKLSVMAGSDAATLERARPAIEAFAAKITLMGEVGAGQNTKAVNQVIVAGIAQAVCEGLALGEALGLGTGLGEDQLQLIARVEDEPGARFGRQAHPVDAVLGGAGGKRLGAVGFDGDVEAASVQAAAQRGVDLKQGLAAGKDDKATLGVTPCAVIPAGQDGIG